MAHKESLSRIPPKSPLCDEKRLTNLHRELDDIIVYARTSNMARMWLHGLPPIRYSTDNDEKQQPLTEQQRRKLSPYDERWLPPLGAPLEDDEKNECARGDYCLATREGAQHAFTQQRLDELNHMESILL